MFQATDDISSESEKTQDKPSPPQQLTQEGRGESEIIEIEGFEVEEEEEEEVKEDGGSWDHSHAFWKWYKEMYFNHPIYGEVCVYFVDGGGKANEDHAHYSMYS